MKHRHSLPGGLRFLRRLRALDLFKNHLMNEGRLPGHAGKFDRRKNTRFHEMKIPEGFRDKNTALDLDSAVGLDSMHPELRWEFKSDRRSLRILRAHLRVHCVA